MSDNQTQSITEYDLVQTVFSLSMASNAIAGITDTLANLGTWLNTYLQGGIYPGNGGTAAGYFNQMNSGTTTGNNLIGGDWKLVWGPGVYFYGPNAASTGTATNTAFVAWSPSQNTFVVAIAGTNFASIVDWLALDLNVLPGYMQEWSSFTVPYKEPNLPHMPHDDAPYISAGTAQGVSNILTQLVGANGASLQTLDIFLCGIPKEYNTNSETKLIFTGHSLGGALSPTLALYLQSKLVTAGWTANNIIVMPTAGPTPGNTQFASLYSQTFQQNIGTGNLIYPNWNFDLISYYPGGQDSQQMGDVVPLSWNQLSNTIEAAENINNQTMYPSIYGYISNDPVQIPGKPKPVGLGSAIFDMVAAAELGVLGGDYGNIPQQQFTPTPGYFDTSVSPPQWIPYSLPSESSPVSTLQQFENLVLYAHTSQYTYYLNCSPIPPTPKQPAG